MRILLVAYEFPPVPSPQSIRWAYLVRELALRGHEIRVLTADLAGYGPGGLPAIPEDVLVHRVYPGLMTAGLRFRRSRVCAGVPYHGVHVDQDAFQRVRRVRLNWKGLLVRSLRSFLPIRHGVALLRRAIERLAAGVLFPDHRAEWALWARSDYHRLLASFRPDVVVTSHEPAFTLPFGAVARRLGVSWLADLGDPVLAGYTASRWADDALRLEGDVCRTADLVSVTAQGTADALRARHGIDDGRMFLLTQGFDARFAPGSRLDDAIRFEPGLLELLYTGSFYAFRRVDALLQAVCGMPGVRLTIATVSPPPEVLEAAEKHPAHVRLVGFLRHDQALDAQRHCDVLVNISNDDPIQVPGKLYEYLGAGTRILHVADLWAGRDAVSAMLEDSGVGLSVQNDGEALAEILSSWRDEKRARGHLVCDRTSSVDVAAHSWQALAGSLERRMADVLAR